MLVENNKRTIKVRVFIKILNKLILCFRSNRRMPSHAAHGTRVGSHVDSINTHKAPEYRQDESSEEVLTTDILNWPESNGRRRIGQHEDLSADPVNWGGSRGRRPTEKRITDRSKKAFYYNIRYSRDS